MNTWNSGSNPTIPEYTYGDKINIKAQVHNTGDAAVNDNVLVYVYAGNPDAVGTTLHDRFAEGWYSGYIGTQILTMFMGGGGASLLLTMSGRSKVTPDEP